MKLTRQVSVKYLSKHLAENITQGGGGRSHSGCSHQYFRGLDPLTCLSLSRHGVTFLRLSEPQGADSWALKVTSAKPYSPRTPLHPLSSPKTIRLVLLGLENQVNG